MIPMGVVPYVVGAALLAGSLGLTYFKGYSSGSASRNEEIAQMLATLERARDEAKRAEARAEEAAKNVRIEYRKVVEQVTVEKEAARELIEVVRRDSSCDLPPSFRVLHNAAAGYPDDKAPARAVSPAEAAETIADNYATARENEAKLAALQNYLAQIQEAQPVK